MTDLTASKTTNPTKKRKLVSESSSSSSSSGPEKEHVKATWKEFTSHVLTLVHDKCDGPTLATKLWDTGPFKDPLSMDEFGVFAVHLDDKLRLRYCDGDRDGTPRSAILFNGGKLTQGVRVTTTRLVGKMLRRLADLVFAPQQYDKHIAILLAKSFENLRSLGAFTLRELPSTLFRSLISGLPFNANVACAWPTDWPTRLEGITHMIMSRTNYSRTPWYVTDFFGAIERPFFKILDGDATHPQMHLVWFATLTMAAFLTTSDTHELPLETLVYCRTRPHCEKLMGNRDIDELLYMTALCTRPLSWKEFNTAATMRKDTSLIQDGIPCRGLRICRPHPTECTPYSSTLRVIDHIESALYRRDVQPLVSTLTSVLCRPHPPLSVSLTLVSSSPPPSSSSSSSSLVSETTRMEFTTDLIHLVADYVTLTRQSLWTPWWWAGIYGYSILYSPFQTTPISKTYGRCIWKDAQTGRPCANNKHDDFIVIDDSLWPQGLVVILPRLRWNADEKRVVFGQDRIVAANKVRDGLTNGTDAVETSRRCSRKVCLGEECMCVTSAFIDSFAPFKDDDLLKCSCILLRPTHLNDRRVLPHGWTHMSIEFIDASQVTDTPLTPDFRRLALCPLAHVLTTPTQAYDSSGTNNSLMSGVVTGRSPKEVQHDYYDVDDEEEEEEDDDED